MSKLSFAWLYKHREYAPLVLRVVVGIVFALHGWQKLTVFGAQGVSGMLSWAGPLAGLMAWVLILVELLGGIALILGAFTRLSSLLLAIVMIVAILTVKLGGLEAPLPLGLIGKGGFELELTLLSAVIALALLGGGKWAVDHKLFGVLPE
jgi:putative oxidoreductase